jgi:hypothetical protein
VVSEDPWLASASVFNTPCGFRKARQAPDSPFCFATWSAYPARVWSLYLFPTRFTDSEMALPATETLLGPYCAAYLVMGFATSPENLIAVSQGRRAARRRSAQTR